MKLIIFPCLFFTGFSVTSDQKSDLCANDWVDATYFGLGCLWTNHTMTGEMSQEEAYAYCYNLDPRAKLLEIYDENDIMVLTTHETILVLTHTIHYVKFLFSFSTFFLPLMP